MSRAIPFFLALLAVAPARAQGPQPHFVLDNGLSVYVLEDHAVPQVAVVTWYEVGSKDEKPGRTGFAHLFEHLMFKGSAHIPDGVLDVLLEGAGGWSNAFTSSDMTVYFDLAAPNFLETILWIEADRMAGLVETLDRPKLDNQRDVVRNERRQSYENRPYGMAPILLQENLWPAGFPYHWPVIGYHADLMAASVEDVRAFFRTWYVPANATMVVAGDVDPAEVEGLVRRYFEWIPKAPEPSPPAVAVPPPLEDEVVLFHDDAVQVPRLYLAWRGPRVYSESEPALDLAARILGGGKSSRLYERLVYDQQLAQDVSASFEGEALAGQFQIEVTAKPGVDPERLLVEVDEVVARLAAKPPSQRELERAKNAHASEVLKQLEPVLWRAIQLAEYVVRLGRPDFLEEDLARYQRVTAQEISSATARWLPAGGRVRLTVRPGPQAGTEEKEAP